jgi:hypothetical protein
MKINPFKIRFLALMMMYGGIGIYCLLKEPWSDPLLVDGIIMTITLIMFIIAELIERK